MRSSIKEIISGSIWGIAGKFLAAVVNFISLPILLVVYGKPDYGLVGLVLSTNAFLQIINMGVPTGAVKFFSEWIEAKDERSLVAGVQSNLCFFALVALINSGVLVFLGANASHYFKVSHPAMLSTLFYLSALLSFPNWYFLTLQHLLLAHEKIARVNMMNSVASILNLLATFVAYAFHAPLEVYFIVYLGTNMVVIPMSIMACKRYNILKAQYLIPAFHKHYFKIIVRYSFTLFSLGLLQVLAVNLQPLILSTMEKGGDVSVANYKILQNITSLISIVSSTFLQSFIPYVSKANYRGNREEIERFLVATTKWLSILIFYLCLLIAFNPSEILHLYVGKQGQGLEIWLTIWVLGVLFNNNQGVASTMLTFGRLRGVIIGVAIATAAALLFSLGFVGKYGIGVAAISYLIYRTIECIVIYGYYVPKVLKMNSWHIFSQSMAMPLIFSVAAIGVTKVLFIYSVPVANPLFYMILFSLISFGIYAFLIYRYTVNNQERNLFVGSVAMLRGAKPVK